MADETQNIGENLELSEGSVETLGAAAGILTQIKGLLYDISKNPLVAGSATVYMSSKIANLVKEYKNLNKELEENKKSLGALNAMWQDPRVKAFAFSTIASLAFKLRDLRREVAETASKLYVSIDQSKNPMVKSTNVMRTALDLQVKYSKEFKDVYLETVKTLETRLRADNGMGGDDNIKRTELLEKITKVSAVTGIDFSKAIVRIQDAFKQYGIDGTKAFAITRMIQKAHEDGAVAIGNLDDNMELSIELLEQYQNQGEDTTTALKNMLATQRAFSNANLTIPQARQITESQNKLGAFGEGGNDARLAFVAAIKAGGGLTNNMKDILFGENLEKKPLTDALFILANRIGGMAKIGQMQQSGLRRVLGVPENQTTPLTSKQLEAIAPMLTQYKGSFMMQGLAPGADFGTINKMLGLDFTKPNTKQDNLEVENKYAAELESITTDTLPAFAKDIDAIATSMGNWLDSLTGWLNEKLLASGAATIPTSITNGVGIGAGALGTYYGGKFAISQGKKLFEKGIAEAAKRASGVAEEVVTKLPTYGSTISTTGGTFSKALPNIAESTLKTGSKFLGFLSDLSPLLMAFDDMGEMPPNVIMKMEDEVRQKTNNFTKIPAQSDSALVRSDIQALLARNRISENMQKEINNYVSVYLDGEQIASKSEDYHNFMKSITPDVLKP